MKDGDERGNLWSIILAGGDEVRTKEFIRRWLGYVKPKQYCVFVGSRSMFQHTLDRAARLTLWDRVVVVAAQHHQDEGWSQCAPERLAVMEMKDVLWSDWGDPARIADTLDKIGKPMAFVEEPLPFLYQG